MRGDPAFLLTQGVGSLRVYGGESVTLSIPPWNGATTPYRRWLPSPLLGEPEWVIERYVFDKMVESGEYDWVATQWAISASDRPDIVARKDHRDGPSFWTIVEVKAAPLRDKHFRQLERYLNRMGEDADDEDPT